MRRKWIKVYVDQCLRGTMTEELEPAERWVWFGILLLAGDSPIEGKIAISASIGFEDHQLADLLKVDLNLFKKAKAKCIQFDKIRVLPGNILGITNWKKYQSEYRRQRPYRQEKEEGSPNPPKEERMENGDRRGEIGEREVTQSDNLKLQQKVTKREKGEEELPPIPKGLDFKIQDKLKDLKAYVRKLKRQYQDKDYLRKCGIDEEELLENITRNEKEYCSIVEDYSD